MELNSQAIVFFFKFFHFFRTAEDKFRDRLAQVAREKLGMLSKEKQLQLERKKKAMAFLNQIKGEWSLFHSEVVLVFRIDWEARRPHIFRGFSI